MIIIESFHRCDNNYTNHISTLRPASEQEGRGDVAGRDVQVLQPRDDAGHDDRGRHQQVHVPHRHGRQLHGGRTPPGLAGGQQGRHGAQDAPRRGAETQQDQ